MSADVKNRPASPLPWDVEQPAHQESKRIVSVLDEETVAGIVREAEDAAYIVHTANAYPKLVQALKNSPGTAEAHALLRELGEI